MAEKKDIAERIEDFKKEVWTHVLENDPDHKKWPVWMLVQFVRYYTEPTRSGKKFLQETFKTWSIGGRLSTWKEKSLIYDRKMWKQEEEKKLRTVDKYKPPIQRPADEYQPPPPDYEAHRRRMEQEPPANEPLRLGERMKINFGK